MEASCRVEAVKPSHARLAIRIATLAIAASALGLALHASQRAADAETQAIAAYRAATVERAEPQRVDLPAVNAALERAWHEAHVARQCVELLWYATNQARRLWPDAPRWSMPASGCPLPPFDEIGSAREWHGRIMAPPAGLRGRKTR